MKKLVLLLTIAVFFASCDDKNKDKGNGKLDPNAMISLRAAKTVNKTSRAEHHLTPLEIVTQTAEIVFVNKVTDPNRERLARGFSDPQRDFANERLLMWGIDIIDTHGRWSDNFICGTDVVLERYVPYDAQYPQYPDGHTDTIAYIKNSTLRAARTPIKEAFDREDYTTVYELFDEAFTFETITGAEWRALKAQGLN